MNKCDNCQSLRIASVYSKANDLHTFEYGGKKHDGYLLDDVGIGGGDENTFKYCLDCGKIQGTFPISDQTVYKAFKKANSDFDENEEIEIADEYFIFCDDDVEITEELQDKFCNLHEEAEKDIEAMSECDWKEYRRLGRILVERNIIPENIIIK